MTKDNVYRHTEDHILKQARKYTDTADNGETISMHELCLEMLGYMRWCRIKRREANIRAAMMQ